MVCLIFGYVVFGALSYRAMARWLVIATTFLSIRSLLVAKFPPNLLINMVVLPSRLLRGSIAVNWASPLRLLSFAVVYSFLKVASIWHSLAAPLRRRSFLLLLKVNVLVICLSLWAVM